ncbi:MAG: caspase family protein [Nodosilinea sp.]
MASYWPVIVGINHYQSLQPLLYAQFDALELKDFLIQEAGLPSQNCSLLTDVAPMVYQGAAFPHRENILQRLRQACDQAGPEDLVWFFFSGYGVHWQDKDYILPIDADPYQIGETGISLQAVFTILTTGGSHRSLVVLDMHRPQSGLTVSDLGRPTLALAQSLSVPLILSCRPDQFSQESLAVRHGFLTEAMIEGLRFHGCLTLAQMAAYLRDRIPELCQHHWRPEQNPVVSLPSDQKFLLLVPPHSLTQTPEGWFPLGDRPELAAEPPLDRPSTTSPTSLDPTSTVPMSSLLPIPCSQPAPASEIAVTSPNRRPWLWAGVAAVGLLVGGVLVGALLVPIQGRFRPQPSLKSEIPPTLTDLGTPGTTNSPQVSLPQMAGKTIFNDAYRLVEPLPASRFNDAIEKLRQIPPEDPLYPQVQSEINRWSWVILDLARGRAVAGNLTGAMAAARLVPADQVDAYGQAQAQMRRWQQQETNRQLLQKAQALLQPEQATTYRDGILLLQEIPANYPESAPAQERIDQWSRDMLAIAQVRAVNGQLPAAIAAANLIPPATSAYDEAQQQLKNWQGH